MKIEKTVQVDTVLVTGQEKQVPLPRASKFWSLVIKNRSLVAQWASEISLSGPVSLSKSVKFPDRN